MPDPYALLPSEVVPDGAARLKALRAVLGLGSLRALADALDLSGLSYETLRDIERPSRGRPLLYHEAIRISEHFGVHPSFFTAPARELAGIGYPAVKRRARRQPRR